MIFWHVFSSMLMRMYIVILDVVNIDHLIAEFTPPNIPTAVCFMQVNLIHRKLTMTICALLFILFHLKNNEVLLNYTFLFKICIWIILSTFDE